MNKIMKVGIPIVAVVALLLGLYAVIGSIESPEARGVRERISIDASKDAYLYNGADLYVYSDDHATQKWHADGATGNTDVAGTLQYGADDLYALGYASSGQQAVYGSSEITGTATAAHGLTTVTFALCTLGEDPTSGAGDSAMCSVAISSNVVTLNAWQDDFVTAATEADTMIHWLVIGAP